MLVGVLISIMISIVVGVSLVPTIVSSINTARTTIAATPNAPTGLAGLLDVLSYVFVAVILLGAVAWIDLIKGVGSLIQECISAIPLIRGKLNTLVHANPELARMFTSWASVETLHGTPRTGEEQVQSLLKGWGYCGGQA